MTRARSSSQAARRRRELTCTCRAKPKSLLRSRPDAVPEYDPAVGRRRRRLRFRLGRRHVKTGLSSPTATPRRRPHGSPPPRVHAPSPPDLTLLRGAVPQDDTPVFAQLRGRLLSPPKARLQELSTRNFSQVERKKK